MKEKIEELVEKLKKDPKLLDKFQKNPVETAETLIGVKLPKDQIENIVDGVKAKIDLDKLGGVLGGLFGKK